MKETTSVGHINKCQICSNENLEPVLLIGHQPIVQAYLTKKTLREPEITYPLNLVRCPKCGLVQLDYIVNPEIVFHLNYPYHTGMTNMLIRNFRSLADTLTKKYKLTPDNLIIDIGSNDGTLLRGFKEKGMKVLGVEPTNVAKTAVKNGIPTIQEFFSKKTTKEILKKYGKAKIVTATNVFAHIPNPVGLAKNIATILANDGIFISESQYLLDIVEKSEFDTIYHEHLRFYALKPLTRLFSMAGMSLVNAERINAAGGSIRAYAIKRNLPLCDETKKLINTEEKAGLYDSDKLQEFAKNAVKVKYDLLILLLKCKKDGARIVGIGSPARANTLLGFTKIDNTILDYTCERAGSPKIGLLTPGTHIPIVDEVRLFQDQPEYALILSWHIGKELMTILKKNGYKGKFIIPLPEPKIIERV